MEKIKTFISKFKIPIIVLLIVILILFLVLKKSSTKLQYATEKASLSNIVQSIDASGTINPVKTVNIGSQVSGMISEIYVDYNSQVKKGQLLAQIDPSLFQAQVEKAQGDLNAAIANYQKVRSMLVYDKKNYERYKKLYTKRYVAKSDLDLAQATYESDLAQLSAMDAQIKQTRASLKNNLTNLGYTKIISPVDGLVISRDIDVGQTVAASFQTPQLFQVAQDLKQMQIEVSVSEADIGKVRVGQNVDYTLDGYADEIFKGKVSQVRISPTTVSNVVTYDVIVGVDNEDLKLKPGMSANVSIITNKKENILCVSNKALKFSPSEITGGKKYEHQGLWIVKSNKPTRIEIKTGITDGDKVEIISNELTEGDSVLIGMKNEKEQEKGFKHRMMP